MVYIHVQIVFGTFLASLFAPSRSKSLVDLLLDYNSPAPSWLLPAVSYSRGEGPPCFSSLRVRWVWSVAGPLTRGGPVLLVQGVRVVFDPLVVI